MECLAENAEKQLFKVRVFTTFPNILEKLTDLQLGEIILKWLYFSSWSTVETINYISLMEINLCKLTVSMRLHEFVYTSSLDPYLLQNFENARVWSVAAAVLEILDFEFSHGFQMRDWNHSVSIIGTRSVSSVSGWSFLLRIFCTSGSWDPLLETLTPSVKVFIIVTYVWNL